MAVDWLGPLAIDVGEGALCVCQGVEVCARGGLPGVLPMCEARGKGEEGGRSFHDSWRKAQRGGGGEGAMTRDVEGPSKRLAANTPFLLFYLEPPLSFFPLSPEAFCVRNYSLPLSHTHTSGTYRLPPPLTPLAPLPLPCELPIPGACLQAEVGLALSGIQWGRRHSPFRCRRGARFLQRSRDTMTS